MNFGQGLYFIQVKVHGAQTRRWGHSAVSVLLPSESKGHIEAVVIFGGTSADYEYGWKRLRAGDFPRLAETTIIKFGKAYRLMLLVTIIIGCS